MCKFLFYMSRIEMHAASANGRFLLERTSVVLGSFLGQPFIGSIVLPVAALNITHGF